VVRKTNWTNDSTLTASAAASLLRGGLQFNLSRSIIAAQQQQPPNLIEVWFQPDPTGTTAGPDTPLPMVSIFGSVKVTPQTIQWIPNTSPEGFKLMMRSGRVLIRAHMGTLLDAKSRQFSGTLTAVLGVEGLVLPGGVFESWFLVR
jgi:hypothetical protein